MQRAIERRQAPPDVPGQTLAQCLYGAVTMQALSLSGDDRKLSDDQIMERVRPVVAFVLAAAGA